MDAGVVGLAFEGNTSEKKLEKMAEQDRCQNQGKCSSANGDGDSEN